jgi:hypothetical protein
VDDALMDALLHQSPLSPFLLACNKKMLRRAIAFLDPPPQRSLKSICTYRVRMMRSWMLYCTDPLFPLSFWPATKKSQAERLFFQILHLNGVSSPFWYFPVFTFALKKKSDGVIIFLDSASHQSLKQAHFTMLFFCSQQLLGFLSVANRWCLCKTFFPGTY